MAGNGGFVSLNTFKAKLQLNEGTRLQGMDPSMAGKKIEMNWNEAMLAEAQGWGKMDIGWRPHHSRPTLMGKKEERNSNVHGVTLAQERVKQHNAKKGSVVGTSMKSGNDGIRTRGTAAGTTVQNGGSSGSKSRVTSDEIPILSGATTKKDEDKKETSGMKYIGNMITAPAEKDNKIEKASAPIHPSWDDIPLQSKKESTLSTEGDYWQAMKDANDCIGGLIRAQRLFRQRKHGVDKNYKANDRCILKIGNQGILFVGDIRQGVPDGQGILLLPDGAQHWGSFKNGRAHGKGIYLTDGTACEGLWDENKRNGLFNVLDGKGKTWQEKHDAIGKKVARKCIKQEEEDLTQLLPKQCTGCNLRYHEAFNHNLACRKHAANILIDPEKKEEPIWTCCGARGEKTLGCEFQRHQS